MHNKSQDETNNKDLRKTLGEFIQKLELDLNTLKHSYGIETEDEKPCNFVDTSSVHEDNEVVNCKDPTSDELKEEILFLREVNESQRLMMEANLEYLKTLEMRIKNLS
jgi:hypothetical protein